MKINFQQALAFTLQYEGGWSDHPRDPGGATMKGVTIGTYSKFKGRGVSRTELRNIPDADLQAIYRQNYWDAVRGDDRPAGYDLCLFDWAVNSGPARALKADRAISAGVQGRARIKAISARRLSFVQQLSTFGVFGKGWTRRIVACEALALRLAGASGGALIEEAQDADKRAAAHATGGVATAGGGLAVPASDVAANLSGWVQAGIGVVVLAALGVLIFKTWQHHQRAEAMRDQAWNG